MRRACCSFLWAVAALVVGCRAQIPEGRFACANDGDCPPGQSCVALVCRSNPRADASVFPNDGAVNLDDGGTCRTSCDDEKFCNGVESCSAGSCQPGRAPCVDGCDEEEDKCIGAANTFTLRFVNAYPMNAQARFNIDDTQVATLEYGASSAASPMPAGAMNLRIDDAGGTHLASTTFTLAGPTIVFLTGEGDTRDITVLPDTLVPRAAGMAEIRFVNAAPLAVRIGTQVLDDVRSSTLVPHGSVISVMNTLGPLAVVWLDEMAPRNQVIAGFERLAIDDSVFVVMSGSIDNAPYALGGPRMFVVRSGSGELRVPVPMIRFFNATPSLEGTPAQWCARTSEGATIRGRLERPGDLSTILPVFSVVSQAGFNSMDSAGCDFLYPVSNLASLTAGHRYLSIFAGDGGASEFATVLYDEPVLPAGDTRAHGVFAHVAAVRSRTGPAFFDIDGTPYVPALYAEPFPFLIQMPSRVHFSGTGNLNYGFSPIAPAAFVLFADAGRTSASNPVIYQVGILNGADWMVMGNGPF